MSPTPPRPTAAAQREGVLWRQLDDEVLVLDVPTSRYLRLNRSGSLLWKALSEPRDPTDLVVVLQRAYDVPAPQAAADVDDFLARLAEHGLLRDAA